MLLLRMLWFHNIKSQNIKGVRQQEDWENMNWIHKFLLRQHLDKHPIFILKAKINYIIIFLKLIYIYIYLNSWRLRETNSYTQTLRNHGSLRSCNSCGWIGILCLKLGRSPILEQIPKFKDMEAQHLDKISSKKYPLTEVSAQSSKTWC